MKSILIKDTTREEREQIIKESLDCGSGCEKLFIMLVGRRKSVRHLPGLH